MPNPILTNEQKLNQIYTIVTDMESRRKRAMWFRFLKWILIFGLAYVLVSQPDKIIWPITDYIKPIILSTASGIVAEQRAEMMKNIKDILPADIELQ